MRALHALLNTPWCITDDALRTIVSIARRDQPDLDAVEARLGRKLDYTRTVTERGGVATIPIDGPIFRKANLFTQISGATSLEVLAQDFTTALHNPQVRAIVLAIDSPGGEATGVHEFAGMVAAARGQKPVIAYVEGLGASAAYWIAAACDEVVCDATAMLGSIGVVAVMDAPAEDGSELVFVSTQSPQKIADLATDDGRAQIQALIDRTAAVFVSDVARLRAMPEAAVLALQGSMRVGADAVSAGLADRLGSYEAVLAELQGRRIPPRAEPAETRVAQAAAKAAHSLDRLRRASAAPALPAAVSATVVSTPPKETPMTEQDQALEQMLSAPIPEPPAVADAAMQAHINAYVTQMEARFKAQQDAAFAKAQAEFERRIGEMERRREIESYAQHVTTPTLDRPHALPGAPDQYITFLSSLNGEQRKAAQGLFDSILAGGLVSFEEIGSDREAAPEQTARERFDAAVSAKVAGGLSRMAALQAVGREQPDLYAAYQAESSRRGLVPSKGGK